MSTHKPPASRRTKSRDKVPWQSPNPQDRSGGHHAHLSPAAKAAARRSAKKAGRPYPNLVDNMQAARKQKTKAH